MPPQNDYNYTRYVVRVSPNRASVKKAKAVQWFRSRDVGWLTWTEMIKPAEGDSGILLPFGGRHCPNFACPPLPDWRCDSIDQCPVRVRLWRRLPGGVSSTIRGKARPGRVPPPDKRNDRWLAPYAWHQPDCRSSPHFGGAAALSLLLLLRLPQIQVTVNTKFRAANVGVGVGRMILILKASVARLPFLNGVWISFGVEATFPQVLIGVW